MMGKDHDLLKSIDFGNEAGDDVEPQELASYFVEQSLFQHFLNHKHRINVATAKKGVGKSALIQWSSYKIAQSDQQALVVKCRGADLARSKFGLSSAITTPNEFIHDWMTRIATIVNRCLAREYRIALTDDSIALVEAAELDGYKSRNLGNR
jgi:hypothetical protein